MWNWRKYGLELVWRQNEDGTIWELRGERGFIVGSAQEAAGEVKVRDWHFAGTKHNAKMPWMAGPRQQVGSAGEGEALRRWRCDLLRPSAGSLPGKL